MFSNNDNDARVDGHDDSHIDYIQVKAPPIERCPASDGLITCGSIAAMGGCGENRLFWGVEGAGDISM